MQRNVRDSGDDEEQETDEGRQEIGTARTTGVVEDWQKSKQRQPVSVTTQLPDACVCLLIHSEQECVLSIGCLVVRVVALASFESARVALFVPICVRLRSVDREMDPRNWQFCSQSKDF